MRWKLLLRQNLTQRIVWVNGFIVQPAPMLLLLAAAKLGEAERALASSRVARASFNIGLSFVVSPATMES
jgi:hypothetical protein